MIADKTVSQRLGVTALSQLCRNILAKAEEAQSPQPFDTILHRF
jgi:hypothetical protein